MTSQQPHRIITEIFRDSYMKYHLILASFMMSLKCCLLIGRELSRDLNTRFWLALGYINQHYYSRVSLNRANLLSCLWINLCIVCGFSTLLISLHARDAIARIISSRRKGNLVFIAYCKRKIICLFFQTSFHWERKISYSRQLFFNASHSF